MAKKPTQTGGMPTRKAPAPGTFGSLLAPAAKPKSKAVKKNKAKTARKKKTTAKKAPAVKQTEKRTAANKTAKKITAKKTSVTKVTAKKVAETKTPAKKKPVRSKQTKRVTGGMMPGSQQRDEHKRLEGPGIPTRKSLAAATLDRPAETRETPPLPISLSPPIEAIFENFLRDLQSGDVDKIMRYYAGNSTREETGRDKPAEGKEAIRARMDETLTAFSRLRIEVKKLTIAERTVVAETVWSGKHVGMYRGILPSQRNVEFFLMERFEFDDEDKICKQVMHLDDMSLAVSMGVLPNWRKGLGKLWLFSVNPRYAIRKLLSYFR